MQQRDVHGTLCHRLLRGALALYRVRDVVHVAQCQDVLPVAARGGDAGAQQRAAAFCVDGHALTEEVAAAEDALAVRAVELSALVQQLQRARLVLRNTLTRVAAACSREQ